jgi:hypothetical protein
MAREDTRVIRIYTISYAIGTYSGTVEVSTDPDTDSEVVLAQAKTTLRRQAGGTLPFGAATFKITDWRDQWGDA